MTQKHIDLDKQDHSGNTALHKATVEVNNVRTTRLMRILMFKDASVNIENDLGLKPVDLLDGEDVIKEWDPDRLISTKQLLLDRKDLLI